MSMPGQSEFNEYNIIKFVPIGVQWPNAHNDNRNKTIP